MRATACRRTCSGAWSPTGQTSMPTWVPAWPRGLAKVAALSARQREAAMSTIETTIAGIRIPDSALARDVTQFVQDVESPLLFDHSRRVFLWASLQGDKHGLWFDPE